LWGIGCPNFEDLRARPALEYSRYSVTVASIPIVEMGNGGSKPEQHTFNAYVHSKRKSH
jgi:hypothetical protein